MLAIALLSSISTRTHHRGSLSITTGTLACDTNSRSVPAATLRCPLLPSNLKRSARSRGVTIEASYTVGEYDILILSAKESNGLIRWLNDNGYKMPRGAEKVVVDSYLEARTCAFSSPKLIVEEQSKARLPVFAAAADRL